jgi:hypothetical protein
MVYLFVGCGLARRLSHGCAPAGAVVRTEFRRIQAYSRIDCRTPGTYAAAIDARPTT